MSLLPRFLRSRVDPREALRPLWHQIVSVSREQRWYREGGVADSVPGRFDMIATVLALVLLRLEQAAAPPEPGVYLTELFVEDMDRQLREGGVGDLMVGKHIGRLLSVLGGRLGALREALASQDEHALTAAVDRNITLAEGVDPISLAGLVRAYNARLQELSPETILSADLPQ